MSNDSNDAAKRQAAKSEPLVCAGMPAEADEMREAAYNLGKWLSAALDDPNVCDEMKRDIHAWFSTGMPFPADARTEVMHAVQGALYDYIEFLKTEAEFADEDSPVDSVINNTIDLYHAVRRMFPIVLRPRSKVAKG